MSHSSQSPTGSRNAFLRFVLATISFHLVPLAIAVFSIIAFVFWTSRYGAEAGRPLRMQVIQSDAISTPDEARSHLASVRATRGYETRLSEAPVWFIVKPSADGRPSVIELPSRHARDLECWDGATLEVLGKSAERGFSAGIVPAKSGFVLASPPDSAVCRVRFAGPARLTALQWSSRQFALSEAHFHRQSGLLDGGLGVLAVFMLFIALFSREKLYVLFAVWLCLNLRVAALSTGWDVQWLGQRVPEDWLLPMRTVTIALYALVTLELYINLFREQIPRTP
ncbi:MAG TPA: diguanylate cyclase, partial [Noviherbaspirillum sp.]|nr:diguanylate cyclase [Noviherbaspirillum sp.]